MFCVIFVRGRNSVAELYQKCDIQHENSMKCHCWVEKYSTYKNSNLVYSTPKGVELKFCQEHSLENINLDEVEEKKKFLNCDNEYHQWALFDNEGKCFDLCWKKEVVTISGSVEISKINAKFNEFKAKEEELNKVKEEYIAKNTELSKIKLIIQQKKEDGIQKTKEKVVRDIVARKEKREDLLKTQGFSDEAIQNDDEIKKINKLLISKQEELTVNSNNINLTYERNKMEDLLVQISALRSKFNDKNDGFLRNIAPLFCEVYKGHLSGVNCTNKLKEFSKYFSEGMWDTVYNLNEKKVEVLATDTTKTAILGEYVIKKDGKLVKK